MAVEIFKEIHRGRSGKVSFDQGGSSREYVRQFLVVTTAPTDDPTILYAHANCPSIGDQYPSDSFAACNSLNARAADESKKLWYVQASYKTSYNVYQSSSNPLNDPAIITWSTEQYREAVWKDKDDKAIVNSAGQFFDPTPEVDVSRWLIQIQKNVANVPSWVMDYQDTVNSTSFTVDGRSIQQRCAKMQRISIGSYQFRNNVYYRVLTFQISLKKGTWDLKIADMGMEEKDPANPNRRREIRNPIGGNWSAGEPVSAPVPLDGNGSALVNPTPNNIQYITVRVYEEKDFSILPLS